MLGLQQPAPAALQPAGARTSDAPTEAPRDASSSAVTECVAKYRDSTPDSSLVRQLSDEAGSEEAGLQALVDIVRERERARLLQHSPATTALQQPTLSEQRPGPSAPASSVDTFSDEFRMYHFKVRLCSKSSAHDWMQCPYAHEGEKARRRDPLVHNYSGAACADFRKGSCAKGDSCPMAHGVFECWLHPHKYRTELCREGLSCQRRVCFFAHTPSELRVPDQPAGSTTPPPAPAPAPAPAMPAHGAPAQAAAVPSASVPDRDSISSTASGSSTTTDSITPAWPAFTSEQQQQQRCTELPVQQLKQQQWQNDKDQESPHTGAHHNVRSPLERLVRPLQKLHQHKSDADEPQVAQRNSSVPREQSFSHIRWIEGLMEDGEVEDYVGE